LDKFKIAAKISLPLKQQPARLGACYKQIFNRKLSDCRTAGPTKILYHFMQSAKSGSNMQNRHILPLHEDTDDII